jgi:transcriptional regulator EpsA
LPFVETPVWHKKAARMEHHENRDRLITVLESATKVLKPSHFFAWTQGPLQALIPHEILICGMADGPGQELRLRYFTATRYFKPEHFEAASNPRNGLITQVVNHWKATHQPCLIPAPSDKSPCDAQWEKMLHLLELRNMAAHGHLAQHGGLNAWFGFFRVGDLGHHTAYLLELLLPCITVTYARVLSHEASASGQTKALVNTLSRREMQVLELIRDGGSNQDIADHLAISAMTAKNHVQNIRIKLKVRTRGQAVAEAMRLAIIRPKQDGS